ncbi:MAG: aminotransferase class V-fold PLP-dependent enzyme [Acholeplasmatales bacterium]|jgi:cysteine desulfurase/selenocysteine lyase|nr:aminotransferase class V-fold PLP-dependent enzyme [Acholeplasmatales bacterium]
MNYRKYFPIYKKNEDLVYLDSSATALKLKSVIDKETTFLRENGTSSHSAGYELSTGALQDMEKSRNLVAKYLNTNPKNIIFTKGTTESINIIMNGLEDYINENDEIISSPLDHHSLLMPVGKLCKKKKAINKFINLTDNEITITEAALQITKKTKIIAITHVSNALGVTTPIKEITKIAHKNNILVVLDCAQSVPHMRLDTKDLDVDFLAFSFHKIFGPFGVGVLYGKDTALELIKPLNLGGGMVYEFLKDGESLYKEIPYSFEGGTPNVSGIIAASESILFLDSLDFETKNKEIEALSIYAVEELKKIKEVTIYNKGELGIINFNVRGIHCHDIQTFLSSYNISVRAGHHCASLVMKHLNILTSLRVSIQIYNTKLDIDIFISKIKEAIIYFNRYEEK